MYNLIFLTKKARYIYLFVLIYYLPGKPGVPGNPGEPGEPGNPKIKKI